MFSKCSSIENCSRECKYTKGKEKAPISRGYSLSKPFISERVECIYGGSDEDRTRYLLHAMEALSQVSYGPITAQLLYIKRGFRQYDFITFYK